MPKPLDVADELKGVVGTLTRAKIPFAVCGAFAVAIHGHPRATRDIDLLIEEDRVEDAFSALRTLGFTLRAGPIPFGSRTPSERRLYRATKVVGTEHVTVDLLVVTPVLRQAWERRQTFALDWGAVPVVSRDDLMEMKRLAGRNQDLADLERLERGEPEY